MSAKECGKEAVDKILKLHGDTPLNNNPKWENRPRTKLIKTLIEQSNIDLETLAEYLDCSKQYLNNKISRDSFSIDDLIIAAYVCGYDLILASREGDKNRPVIRITKDKYFPSDDKTLARIEKIDQKRKAEIKAEYERKKAELERMKEQYGLED